MDSKDPAYHILLAEDSDADVGIVRLALREQGFDHVLHVARDGEEAIAFIEKVDRNMKAPGPDLLLVDMHLPRYNGEQILKHLRSTERYAQTPVIVMTSSEAPEDQDGAIKHGALFYFRKPSRLDDFLQLGAIVRDILKEIRNWARNPRVQMEVTDDCDAHGAKRNRPDRRTL